MKNNREENFFFFLCKEISEKLEFIKIFDPEKL